MNRIIVATLMGVVAGGLCTLGGISMGTKMTPVLLIWILLNRTLMGFSIGISNLKLPWALHGSLMGLIVGSVFSFTLYMRGAKPTTAAMTMIGNLLYGFLIELFTSVVFKQRQRLVTVGAKGAAV